jgi:hypothetical protein
MVSVGTGKIVANGIAANWSVDLERRETIRPNVIIISLRKRQFEYGECKKFVIMREPRMKSSCRKAGNGALRRPPLKEYIKIQLTHAE